jgi:hypothetical protein
MISNREAINSDKFKEIMTNAGYLLINDKVNKINLLSKLKLFSNLKIKFLKANKNENG